MGISHGKNEIFEKSLKDIFQTHQHYPEVLKNNPELSRFFESVNYSLLGGGKRFRPHLVFAVAESYKHSIENILPLAIAIEMIHTYSLIHDDLPCMDNDSERRGKPTNHVVYGDAVALLAGDALLTEAFSFLAKSYAHQPKLGMELLLLLGEAAGVRGMIGGQVLDILTKDYLNTEQIMKMLEMKTGALIRLSIEASAAVVLHDQDPKKKSEIQNLWKKLGELVGLSFQLADDLLDYDQQKKDLRNFASATSVEETKNLLTVIEKEAKEILEKLTDLEKINTENFKQIIDYNLTRKT